MATTQVSVDEIVMRRTGKPPLRYIDNGFFQITEAQARKIGGRLPAPGCILDLDEDGHPLQPPFPLGEIGYSIMQTYVDGGYVWAICPR